MDNSVFKMDFGYYSKDGKFLGTKKPKNPQPGDFWVRRGPFGNPDIEIFDIRKYGYGTDEDSPAGYSNYRLHPSYKGSKGISKTIPKALWQHAYRDVKTVIPGTGRENTRGKLIGAKYENKSFKINNKGLWTAKVTPTKTANTNAIIQARWPYDPTPGKTQKYPNNLNFEANTKDGYSQEDLNTAFNEAVRRYNRWQELRKLNNNAKGRSFHKEGLPGTNHTHYYYTPGAGWTPDMDNEDYEGIEIQGKHTVDNHTTFEKLPVIKKHYPKRFKQNKTVESVNPSLSINSDNYQPDYIYPKGEQVFEGKEKPIPFGNDSQTEDGTSPLDPTAANLQADLRALNTLNKQNLRGLQGTNITLAIMRKEQQLSKLKGDTHPSFTGRDHHGVGHSTNREARDWLKINKL